MKQFIVLILFYCIVIPKSTAQSDNWKNIIITAEKDTVTGKVDNLYPTFFKNEIRLKIKGRNFLFYKEYAPSEIISVSSDRGYIRSATVEGEEMFLMVEVVGDCNLYKTYSKDSYEPEFYIRKEAEDFIKLLPNKFKEQLRQNLETQKVKDYIDKRDRWLGYNTADISSIIARYNFKENISDIPEDNVQDPEGKYGAKRGFAVETASRQNDIDRYKKVKPYYVPNQIPKYKNKVNTKLGIALNTFSSSIAFGADFNHNHNVLVTPEIFLKLKSERMINYTIGYFSASYVYDYNSDAGTLDFDGNFTENVYWVNNTLDYDLSARQKILVGVMIGFYQDNYSVGKSGAKLSYYTGFQYFLNKRFFVNGEIHLQANTPEIATDPANIKLPFQYDNPTLFDVSEPLLSFNIKVGLLLF